MTAILTVAEAAEHIKCSPKHIRAMIARGALKASHLPGRTGTRGILRIRLSDLDALLDNTALAS